MTCQELTELVTDYLERRMPLIDRLRFHAHVGMCGGCRAYLNQMKHTVRLLGRLSPDDIPPEIRDQLLERFRHWRR